jgi:hypothetical protein
MDGSLHAPLSSFSGGLVFFVIIQGIHDFILRSTRASTFCHFMSRLDTTFIASYRPRVIDTPRIGEYEGVLFWRPACCGLLPGGVSVIGLDESRYHTKCSFKLLTLILNCLKRDTSSALALLEG